MIEGCVLDGLRQRVCRAALVAGAFAFALGCGGSSPTASTPAPTPAPTPTPETHDGTWQGTMSQGQTINFTVAGEQITALSVNVFIPHVAGPAGSGCLTLLQSTAPVPWSSSGFEISVSGRDAVGDGFQTTVSGGFASFTSAQGVIHGFHYRELGCPNGSYSYSSNGDDLPGVVWQASKQ